MNGVYERTNACGLCRATPVIRLLRQCTAVAFASLVLISQGVARDQCSFGDARALLESVPVANEILVMAGPDHPWAHTLLTCQYRLFWETGHPVLGQPISFSQEDFFLGGVTFFVPYKLLGMTRAQAEEILEAIEVQVWLAEVTENGVGELEQQPLMETTAKQTVANALGGFILYKQWGFIDQLPPGEYVTATEVKRPIFFQDERFWTVEVFISGEG